MVKKLSVPHRHLTHVFTFSSAADERVLVWTSDEERQLPIDGQIIYNLGNLASARTKETAEHDQYTVCYQKSCVCRYTLSISNEI